MRWQTQGGSREAADPVMMHPEIMMRIAEDRVGEMIKASSATRHPARRPRARLARRRAGWALVGLGLRLALSAERSLRS